MSTTASELFKELETDKEYQRKQAILKKEIQTSKEQLTKYEKPILDDLKNVDINISSIWDLVNTTQLYERAIPILLDHLGKRHPMTLEGSGRALALPSLRGNNVVWKKLLKLYESLNIDDPIDSIYLKTGKDGLAVALATLCTKEKIHAVIKLIHDKRHGQSRAFLIHEMWRFYKFPEVKQLIIDLMDDEHFSNMAKEIYKKRYS